MLRHLIESLHDAGPRVARLPHGLLVFAPFDARQKPAPSEHHPSTAEPHTRDEESTRPQPTVAHPPHPVTTVRTLTLACCATIPRYTLGRISGRPHDRPATHLPHRTRGRAQPTSPGAPCPGAVASREAERLDGVGVLSSWRALMLWSIPARVARKISGRRRPATRTVGEVTGKPKFRPAGTL